MQKAATKIFIIASIIFGALGITNVFMEFQEDTIMFKLFISTIFIILPSFALSIAGRYLDNRSK